MATYEATARRVLYAKEGRRGSEPADHGPDGLEAGPATTPESLVGAEQPELAL